jgi:hypothetical protein
MAISSGVGPHKAWVTIPGGTFLLEEGMVTLRGNGQTGEYRGRLPMGLPGAYETFAGLGQNSSSIIVETRGIEGTLVTGPILKIDFDHIAGIIRFNGQDAGAILQNTKTTENFANMTGAGIVQKKGGELGFPVQVNVGSGIMAGKTVDLQNYNKLTDGYSVASLFQKLAELDGARWYVDGQGVLHYTTSPASGGYSVNYNAGPPKRADFIELTVEVNTDASQTQETTCLSWQCNEKQVNQATASAGGRAPGTKHYRFHVSNSTQDHVQAYAQSKAKQMARHGVTIVAHCVGDPSITINQGLSVNGTAFDGLYTIDELQHAIGMRGHLMMITARSDAGGGGGGGATAGAPNFTPRPPAAPNFTPLPPSPPNFTPRP